MPLNAYVSPIVRFREAKRTTNPFAVAKTAEKSDDQSLAVKPSGVKRTSEPALPAKSVADMSPSKPKPLKASKFSDSPVKTPVWFSYIAAFIRYLTLFRFFKTVGEKKSIRKFQYEPVKSVSPEPAGKVGRL